MTTLHFRNTSQHSIAAKTIFETQKRTPVSMNEAELHTLANRTRSTEMKFLWQKISAKLGFSETKTKTTTASENGNNQTFISMDDCLQRAA